jgi:paired amphipathic helix protein Sin3a
MSALDDAAPPPAKKKRTSANSNQQAAAQQPAYMGISAAPTRSTAGKRAAAAATAAESSARLEPAPGPPAPRHQPPHTHIQQPLAQPTPKPRPSTDEIAFFDRIARYLDDRQSYHEFLKLCNLYTQDTIDLPTLVERAFLFIGNAKELWAHFRDLVRWRDDRVEGMRIDADGVRHIDNVPITVTRGADVDREAYGPSYRKLPDSVRLPRYSLATRLKPPTGPPPCLQWT